MKLHISKSFSMPLDAVMRQHLIVGQSGSGKTNEAVVFCEELAKADQQFVVVDEPGVWWGLRSSLDGKGAGISVVILGGEHGDMPLEPTSGSIVADFIVKSGHSFILDLSLMRRGQVTLFMLDFCTRLYEAKATNKDPLHLVIDEADLYVPEVPHERGNGKLLLDAIDTIARRGRSRGLQETFITQRPQTINKSVIAQSEVLHVFRLSHPLDRKALESWVRGNASVEEIDAFNKGIATLERGECFVWSPQYLKIFKKVHIRQRETFDSSSTPEVGVKAAKPRVMAKVDIEGLKQQIAATIEIAKAEDPKILRAQIETLTRARTADDQRHKMQIEDLTRQLGERQEVTKTVEVPVLDKATANSLHAFVDDFAPIISDLKAAVDLVSTALGRVGKTNAPTAHSSPSTPHASRSQAREPRASKARLVAADGYSPNKCERAILNVLAQRRGHATSIDQLSLLTEYSQSGSFSAALASLRSHGMIVDLDITDQGVSFAPDPQPMPHGRALLDLWLSKLSKSERAILEAVYETHPKEMTPYELAEWCGYSMSGSFSAALANLRATKLLVGTRLGPALAEAM